MGFIQKKEIGRSKWISAFFLSAGILLLTTALAKLVSSFGNAKILDVADPLLGLGFRRLFQVVGAVELIIALVCLLSTRRFIQAALVSWLATSLLFYRFGLVLLNYHEPCSCLGSLTGSLHISPKAADMAMKIILAYLLIGSFAVLSSFWQQMQKGVSIERVSNKWRAGILVALLLAILTSCLLGTYFYNFCNFAREIESSFILLQETLVLSLLVWCGVLTILARRIVDWPLIVFSLLAVVFYFSSKIQVSNALVILFGIALGKGARFLLRGKIQNKISEKDNETSNLNSEVGLCLVGLVVLFVFASWKHPNMAGSYHGPRWMGLWDNPNTYGMLMGAGGLLAIGLRAGMKKGEGRMKKPAWASWNSALRIFLWIAITMLGVGLVMSYSRGAWLGTSIGLLYLAWIYGKIKWRYVLPGAAVVALVVLYFWGSTPDSAPWYVKRADLGRPSAQHRASAWRAGLEIMLDHPFGVGWNNAVKTYQEHYNPPEDGAAAITTNDYLMIGTELGIAALHCFVGYAVLCLRGKCNIETEEGRLQAACRAGAIVLLVAFWFDGGLFKLPTAAVFWILLELGGSLVHKHKCTASIVAAV